MAPDIALRKIDSLTEPGQIVLDPMCGSGTVPRLAAESGRRAIASDLDPLAVLMTRTACKPQWSVGLSTRAAATVSAARRLDDDLPAWIAGDPPSAEFVNYWFADTQRHALSRLARILVDRPRKDDPLRVALSRLIVTKDRGASLARDTSHSRPHRVRDDNDYDVYDEFIQSAKRVEQLVESNEPDHRASIRSVDARQLGFVSRSSVDLVVTSPPYLNAIDYLRGHRMSLVWLGHRISNLRAVRSESIGAERGLLDPDPWIREMVDHAVPLLGDLPGRHQRMIWRFGTDMDRLCRSLARVIKPGGSLVFVVADSQLKGVPVSNTEICHLAAERHGLNETDREVRPLPAQHRYLPPPNGGSGINARMREEAILTFESRS